MNLDDNDVNDRKLLYFSENCLFLDKPLKSTCNISLIVPGGPNIIKIVDD